MQVHPLAKIYLPPKINTHRACRANQRSERSGEKFESPDAHSCGLPSRALFSDTFSTFSFFLSVISLFTVDRKHSAEVLSSALENEKAAVCMCERSFAQAGVIGLFDANESTIYMCIHEDKNSLSRDTHKAMLRIVQLIRGLQEPKPVFPLVAMAQHVLSRRAQ